MEKRNITTFEEAVDYVYEIPRFTTKNTVEDTRAFLERLGSPDLNMKIIHVAGTNGKGSVCAYMRSVLESAGERVAVFTSPHLVDVRERFLIEGKMPEKEEFLAAFHKVYDILDWEALAKGEGYHPTFFEFMFFIGMLLFADRDLDHVILETGLGGRLDATNSVHRKELALITRIGLDHTEYLGDTLPAIAGEKAGIMMQGVPTVFADNDEECTKVFLARAKELSCPVYPVGKEVRTFLKKGNKSIDFSLCSDYYDSIEVTANTGALYQMENIALAVRGIEVIDTEHRITKEQIVSGIAACSWAGRMEEVLPEVYLDGAHNEDGIGAFLESVAADGWDGKRTLIFSAVRDKTYREMLHKLASSGYFHKIVLAAMHSKRGASLRELEEGLAGVEGLGSDKFPLALCGDVKSAVNVSLARQKQDERIYIAGSLYLVGEVKEILADRAAAEGVH